LNTSLSSNDESYRSGVYSVVHDPYLSKLRMEGKTGKELILAAVSKFNTRVKRLKISYKEVIIIHSFI